jgi:hypothetical protein
MSLWRRKPSAKVPAALLTAYVEALVIVKLCEAVAEHPELAHAMRFELLSRARRCAALLQGEAPRSRGNVLRFKR